MLSFFRKCWKKGCLKIINLWKMRRIFKFEYSFIFWTVCVFWIRIKHWFQSIFWRQTSRWSLRKIWNIILTSSSFQIILKINKSVLKLSKIGTKSFWQVAQKFKKFLLLFTIRDHSSITSSCFWLFRPTHQAVQIGIWDFFLKVLETLKLKQWTSKVA